MRDIEVTVVFQGSVPDETDIDKLSCYFDLDSALMNPSQ